MDNIRFNAFISTTLVAIFFAADLAAYQFSSDIGVESSARSVRYSSALNPGNVQGENQFSCLIRGSVMFKNDFSQNVNGMIRLGAEGSSAKYRQSDVSERVYIKEGYIDLAQQYFSIRTGRQFIKWGSGVFFNPSDVVNNTRDPLRPASDAEGVTFAQVSVPIESFAAVDLFGIVRQDDTEKLQSVPLCARFSFSSSNLSSFVFLMRNGDGRPVSGFDISYVTPLGELMTMMLYSESHFKLKSDRTVVSSNAGSYAAEKRGGGSYLGVMGGSQLTLKVPGLKTFDAYKLTAEYCYDDENMSKGEYSTLLDSVKSDPANAGYYLPFKSSKSYLYTALGISNFMVYDLTFSWGSVINLSDKSVLFVPSFSYLYADSTELTLKSQITCGKSDSEFGSWFSAVNTTAGASYSF